MAFCPREEFYSEYQTLEVSRHTLLTDRFCLKFNELPKLPEIENADDELKLWLTLFNSKTEEDLEKIEAMGVSIMEQAISAYRTVTATEEFRQIERMRADARNIEASALGNARRRAIRETDEKWQGVVTELRDTVADKDAALADKDAEIERLRAKLANKNI